MEIITRNRRHLQHAQDLFDRLEGLGPDVPAEDEAYLQLHHEYRLALITLNAHHEIVSAVVGALGHVPDVPMDDAGERTSTSALN